MTLDEDMLTLYDQKRIWEKRPYHEALINFSWAITVFHEYIHMDQKDPQNTKAFEDPAWQQTDQALARWYERLKTGFEDLKNKPASSMRDEQLQELEDLLKQLKSQSDLLNNTQRDCSLRDR